MSKPFLFSPLHFFSPLFSPESASSSSFPVKDGDIVLVATDGLFDNMPEEMIIKELAKIKVRLGHGCSVLCNINNLWCFLLNP